MELRPCPFCGSPRVEVTGTFAVECQDCGAKSKYHNTREQAVTAWTNRISMQAGKFDIRKHIADLVTSNFCDVSSCILDYSDNKLTEMRLILVFPFTERRGKKT